MRRAGHEPERATAVADKLRARGIAQWLLVTYGLSNERFSQLTTGWNRPNIRLRVMHYGMWLERVDWGLLTPAEQRVVRRFEALYYSLRQDATFRDALAAALEAEPFDPGDPAEHSVG